MFSWRFVLVFALATSVSVSEELPAQSSGTVFEELTQAQNWRQLLRAADRALVKEPDSVDAWQYRAYALHQLGRLSEAHTAYERTLGYNPRNRWALLNLSAVSLREERWEDALDAAKKALALDPARDAYEHLSRAHRGLGAYEDAILLVHTASAEGIDPSWCHAELGYLTWVVESPEESEAHWHRARELGFDPDACAHGIRIAQWDLEKKKRALETNSEGDSSTPVLHGEPWVFPVGRLEVHTGIGPELPEEIDELLVKLQGEIGKFLGIRGTWSETVRLDLHRTLEEHDSVRRKKFPTGYRGRGFLVQEPLGRSGRDRRRRAPKRDDRRGPFWRLEMHVAYSEPDLERSLSHELAHAMLHVRTPRSFNTSVWFDEGLATYLELSPNEKGKWVWGQFRPDLLKATLEARDAGTLLPWKDMLVAPRWIFEGPSAYSRYAQAWAMIYFLTHKSSSGKARLRKYISGLETEGRNWLGGFSTVWGSDFDAIDRRFKKWLEKEDRD